MKSSKELLRDIEFELANPRRSPLRDNKPTRQSEVGRSEALADKLLEKIRADKEKFAMECRKIKNQIIQVLGDEGRKSSEINQHR